ncbi:MAG TPA: flagellar hook basal-body protein [Candidatus Gastranaerophilales bacterium]|nr:flagellar hook basal-body protein [Candidatus Gastranaerophilales bacterium]
MTTIQGSIAKLADNSKIMFEALGYISSNMSNYNTTGYKTQRFETYMNSIGPLRGAVRTDHSQGDHFATFRELDIAIEGPGFIPITDNNGEIAYTRGGSLSVNAEGYIVSSGGSLVGGGIKIPANYERIKIEPDGKILVLDSKENAFKDIGKIPIVAFKNPEGLETLEGSMFKATQESGKPELLMDHSKIKQGKIERANFEPYAFINETLKVNSSIISSSRFIKILDQMYQEAISLR